MACEADALDAGDIQKANWYAQSQEEFLAGHMLPWLSAWFVRMQNGTQNGFYLGVSYLLFGIVQAYAERFGIYYYAGRDAFEKDITKIV